jgi:enamine deaminase RidA (YjgF/YER057c/UK114 family)
VERLNVSSGSPYEPVMGFSRAVRVGPHVWVAGTAPIVPDATAPEGAYAQTRRCLDIILAALEKAGARAEDVVRTRVYGTRTDIFDDVARAHHEVFGEVSPASAFVVVKELANPAWFVEVEADAIAAA